MASVASQQVEAVLCSTINSVCFLCRGQSHRHAFKIKGKTKYHLFAWKRSIRVLGKWQFFETIPLSINGIVYPKMKIVIIYSPSCHFKPVWLLWITIEDILKNLDLFVSVCTYSTKSLTHFSYFAFHRRKKTNWFGITWGWVNDDKFHFWVNYPFIWITIWRHHSWRHAVQLVQGNRICYHGRTDWP